MRPVPRVAKRFSLFLALRYLRPKRTFVSVITLISIVGVALGVTALVVVISVMRGFEEEIKAAIMGFEPHVRLVDNTRGDLIPDHRKTSWRDLADEVAKIPGVKATSAMIESPVLIEKLGIDGEPLDTDLHPIEMIAIPAEEGDPLYKKFSEMEIREDLPYYEEKDSVGGDSSMVPLPLPDLPPVPGSEGEGADEIPEPEAPPPPPPPFVAPAFVERQPEFNIGNQFGGSYVVVGDWVAKRYNLFPGDRLLVHSPDKLKKLVREIRFQQNNPAQSEEEKEERRKRVEELEELTLPVEVTVTGIYKTPRYAVYLLMNLVTAQELFDFATTDQVHLVGAELEDPYAAYDIQDVIAKQPYFQKGQWGVTNWIERHEFEFELIRSERALLYFVLFILVLVGAFCVMNTMITVTVQKRKEIGVLGALGARVPQIISIFLSQGIVVGTIGTLSGLGLGVLILWQRNNIRSGILENLGLEVLPQKFTGLAEIPCHVVSMDLVIITVGAFLLCSLASLAPAYMAARTHPAQTLRSE